MFQLLNVPNRFQTAKPLAVRRASRDGANRGPVLASTHGSTCSVTSHRPSRAPARATGRRRPFAEPPRTLRTKARASRCAPQPSLPGSDELARLGALDDGPCSNRLPDRRLDPSPPLSGNSLPCAFPTLALRCAREPGSRPLHHRPRLHRPALLGGPQRGRGPPAAHGAAGNVLTAEAATHPIAHGGIWPDPGESGLVDAGHSRYIGPEQGGDSPVDLSVDQAHYRC